MRISIPVLFDSLSDTFAKIKLSEQFIFLNVYSHLFILLYVTGSDVEVTG